VSLDLGLCLKGHTEWVGDFSTIVGVYKDSNRFHSKFRRLNDFQDFKIGKITTFSLDSIMYEGMELAFNQEYQALYVPQCPPVNIFRVHLFGFDNTTLYNTRMYKCHTRVYPTPMMKHP
jgi:hypothetical protein